MRYDDRELSAMDEGAKGIETLVGRMPSLKDLIHGKALYLRAEIAAEAAARQREIETMFVTPEAQFSNLLRWNEERGWGFSPEELREAAVTAPAPVALGGFKAQLLEIFLPDAPDGTPGPRRTFDELWEIAVRESGARPCHLFSLTPDVKLALAPGQSHVPGLRWRAIDLGARWNERDPSCSRHWGIAPHCVPEGIERPHAGVLSAAAHFPLWLKRMDGRAVPHVWLHGYELPGFPGMTSGGHERVAHHPCLSRNDGRPFLYAHWSRESLEAYALPGYL